MQPLHVEVHFGPGVPPEVQAPALLHFEQDLRKSGLDIRVFKQKMGDDSKLRILMSKQERDSL